MRSVFTAAVVIMFAAVAASAYTPTNVVSLADGSQLQGFYNAKSGVSFFKGIPYAEPPVNALRFADPKPAPAWTGVLNATTFAPGCLALCPPTGFPKAELMCAKSVSEDCLYLNVFTPAVVNSTTASGPLLPVVFWIHGGNFAFGSGGVPLYDGQQLASTQNVIVVTINYRLHIFGGLYTGSVKGNFQLKDQILAMQWVQKNIKAFGGDAAAVTLTGQSAGAFSTATHLTMPASTGLFSKAIIVSNPATLLAADPAGAMQLGTKVLEGLGCPQSGGVSELECLRKADPMRILNLSNTDYSFDPNTLLNDMMQWVPVVDGGLVPMQPLDSLLLGAFPNKVPVFFGTVANESVEFIWKLSPKPMDSLGSLALLDLIFGNDTAGVLKQYGLPPADQTKDARDYISFIATDFIFYCVSRSIGKSLAAIVPTYMYYFDFLSSFNPWVFGETMPECVHNVCHAEDLAYVFFPFDWIAQEPGEPLPVPDRERKLAAIVQGAWGNFAHTGNPNPLGAGLGPDAIVPGTSFPLFNFTENVLVNYSVPTSNLVGYHDDKCAFWDSIGYRRRR